MPGFGLIDGLGLLACAVEVTRQLQLPGDRRRHIPAGTWCNCLPGQLRIGVLCHVEGAVNGKGQATV